MRFRFWSPSRIVQALARDHFNHTDRIQEKEDLESAREARAETRKRMRRPVPRKRRRTTGRRRAKLYNALARPSSRST